MHFLKFQTFHLFTLFLLGSVLQFSLSDVVANNVLQRLELSEKGNDPKLSFEFKSGVPEYDVTHESEGEIAVMVYEFKECTSEFMPDIKVVRPVQHITILASKVAGYKSTKVYVYLEKKIPVTHTKTQTQLSSTFN